MDVFSFCVLLHVLVSQEAEKIRQAHIALKQTLTKHFLFPIIIAVAALLRLVHNLHAILTHDEAKDAGLFPQLVLSGIHKDYFGFNAGMVRFFSFCLCSPPFV